MDTGNSASTLPPAPGSAGDIAPVSRIGQVLGTVPGVRAVALGGSRARGLASATSDYDVIVFREKKGDISFDAILEAVEPLAGGKTHSVKGAEMIKFGTPGGDVELFFRQFDRARAEIGEARVGNFQRHLHPLHPYGTVSTLRISYVVESIPVHDPRGELAALIAQAYPYPAPLKSRMIAVFRSEANLACIHARKVRDGSQGFYLSSLYGKFVHACSLVLFAVNETYPCLDKGSLLLLSRLPATIPRFHERSNTLIRAAATGETMLAHKIANALNRDLDVAIRGGTSS